MLIDLHSILFKLLHTTLRKIKAMFQYLHSTLFKLLPKTIYSRHYIVIFIYILLYLNYYNLLRCNNYAFNSIYILLYLNYYRHQYCTAERRQFRQTGYSFLKSGLFLIHSCTGAPFIIIQFCSYFIADSCCMQGIFHAINKEGLLSLFEKEPFFLLI